MKSVACLLAVSLGIMSLFACSHSVEGEGQEPTTTSSTSQRLPAEGESCRCTSPAGQIPPNSCCAGGLVCGDSTGMPGQMLCDSLGCWRSGICVESPFASSSSSSSSSSSGSFGGSGIPEPPPDECSPFKTDNDTCPPGKECHLVRDHWGCV